MANARPTTIPQYGLDTLNALDAQWQADWLDLNDRFQPDAEVMPA